jgi:hypothetical protein
MSPLDIAATYYYLGGRNGLVDGSLVGSSKFLSIVSRGPGREIGRGFLSCPVMGTLDMRRYCVGSGSSLADKASRSRFGFGAFAIC